MAITIRVVSFILMASILLSCAGSYKVINPQSLTYGSKSEADGISYSYQHNVLANTGNKKYAKRELKRPVKLLAVEFTNSTDHEINFRSDVKIFMGDRQVLPMEPSVIHQQLRQPAGLYMLWSLVWLTISKCENEDCSVTPIPIGLLIGIGNTSAASTANKKFLAELNATNILDRKIAPGETVKGLIGITSDTSGSISLKLN
jgi:hypothetical protein